MLETTLQTRVPADMTQHVSALANAEGLTVAAWLRRLVFKEVYRMRVEAHFFSLSERVNTDLTPYYILEPLSPLSALSLECRMWHFDGPSAVSDKHLKEQAWNKDRENHRFYLKGEPHPWKVGRTFFDRSSGTAVILLSVE